MVKNVQQTIFNPFVKPMVKEMVQMYITAFNSRLRSRVLEVTSFIYKSLHFHLKQCPEFVFWEVVANFKFELISKYRTLPWLNFHEYTFSKETGSVNNCKFFMLQKLGALCFLFGAEGVFI